jgi:hypothetical protein
MQKNSESAKVRSTGIFHVKKPITFNLPRIVAELGKNLTKVYGFSIIASLRCTAA